MLKMWSKCFNISSLYNELQSCSRCCFIIFLPERKECGWVRAGGGLESARPGECSDWSLSPALGHLCTGWCKPLCTLHHCITAALQHCSTAGRRVSISDQPGVWWQSSREMGHIGYAENIHHLPMALRLISPAHAVTCSISERTGDSCFSVQRTDRGVRRSKCS